MRSTAENKVNEIAISIENKNQFYLVMILSISTTENNVVENIEFCRK
jgi:hypothetical protein